MSSEQPWPSNPPDLAESQPQYADPYQAQPYSYGGVPQESPQAQGYAAEGGYGYAGYGDGYGYANQGGGYADGQAESAAQARAGYAGYQEYGEYAEYGQYQQYEQYAPQPQPQPQPQPPQPQPQPQPQRYAEPYPESYAAPYAEPYAQPQVNPYVQSYEDPYTQSYAQTYPESPQPPQPPAEEYAAWQRSGEHAIPRYGVEDLDASQDRLVAWQQDRQTAPAPEPEPEPEFEFEMQDPAPAGPEDPTDPEASRQPEPKPRRKRRRRLIAGVGVVIVILGGAAAYKFLGGSTPDDSAGVSANAVVAGGVSPSGSASASASAAPTPVASVTIPSTAGGLTQMTNKVGKAGVSAMQKSAAGNADLANAQFAEYEKTGTSAFFANLTLAQLTKASDIGNTYKISGASATLNALGATSLKGGQTETPSVPGSAMACGQFTTGGNTLSLCIWVDPSEFGLFAGPKTLGNSQAAQYAEAIETASES